MLTVLRAALASAAVLFLLAMLVAPARADHESEDGPTPADEVDLEDYDALAPDPAWRAAIGLPEEDDAAAGAGVTVGVLDTGVTRHPDLGARVAARVDVMPDADGLDRYGHGTHMAGLIAGDGRSSDGRWRGVAGGASLVSVKAAGWNGATDVSVVLAGLEWIAAHHRQYGIRVVNLSYGTDSTQDHLRDPLNHAVQRLWREGVLVIVGAGNRGAGPDAIEKPGDDPFVVTVGAADTKGTATLADDEVAPFSSHEPSHPGVAKPDLLAPGVSLASHRAPASSVDALRPAARLGESYFKGTGTSQAAAVVSGVAARMFAAEPELTPDRAKAVLVATAGGPLAGRPGAGSGLVNAAAAVQAVAGPDPVPPANRRLEVSSGTGSLDRSRGSLRPYAAWRKPDRPQPLIGENDALGARWDAKRWARGTWDQPSWEQSAWAPHTAVAQGWEPASPAEPWGGLGWDAGSWTAKSWGDCGPCLDGWTAKSWGAALWNG